MARKSGPKVALRRTNSSGVGSMIPLVRPAGRVNTGTCPVCGAKRGETCFVMTSRRFVELAETHTGRSARVGDVSPRISPVPPSGRTSARRSTPELDAQYAARKRREAEGRKKLNGG